MKDVIEIDLKQPFDQILTAVRTLPVGAAASDHLNTAAEFETFLREIYEAANGRQVETVLGFVPIAPPVAEFLKAKPFNVTSQLDFLIAAAARIISGPNDIMKKDAERKKVPLFRSNNKKIQTVRRSKQRQSTGSSDTRGRRGRHSTQALSNWREIIDRGESINIPL